MRKARKDLCLSSAALDPRTDPNGRRFRGELWRLLLGPPARRSFTVTFLGGGFPY